MMNFAQGRTLPPMTTEQVALLERVAAADWARQPLRPEDVTAQEHLTLLRLMRLGLVGVTFTAIIEARSYYPTPLGQRVIMRIMGRRRDWSDGEDWSVAQAH